MLRRITRKLLALLALFGWDLRKTAASLFGAPHYLWAMMRFLRQLARSTEKFQVGSPHPVIGEWRTGAGTASGQYFHQDLLVAQKICRALPQKHVDVGSRVDGFVAHVAAFMEVEVLDIRPQKNLEDSNIRFHRADLMSLDPKWRACTSSLSCLHTIEHIGLGRYGDSIDATGHLKALTALASMLRDDGILYLSFPIGQQRVNFNAQRVFSLSYMLSKTTRHFELVDLAYVDDQGDLHQLGGPSAEEVAENCGCNNGLAILTLRRRGSIAPSGA